MATAPASRNVELAKKIDRCACLIEREREAKPLREELARLKTELQLSCGAHPADLPLRLEGLLYYLDFTARENRREISDKPAAFKALRKALGLDALILKLTIPFKLLDAEVSAEKQAAYVTSERTGTRDISAGLLQAPKTA